MKKRDYTNPEAEKAYRAMAGDLSALPFSFKYGDRAYTGFSADDFTPVGRHAETLGNKEANVFELKADENLDVRVETAYYPSHGAYEWTVWFINGGNSDTKVISDVWAADMEFAGEKPVLRGILGDHENSYRPYERDLAAGRVNFKSVNGRPTHIFFPYFNLEFGGGGALLAIGWGGTWEADFQYGDGRTRFRAAGVNGLSTYLKPGERIRSALILVIPYNVRDEDYATNLWRDWFINCNMPRRNASGEPIRPFCTTCVSNDTGLPNSDGSISERHFTWKPSLEKILAEGIEIDYRWFDAGWYVDPYGNTVETDWWGTVGSWELDKAKWPGRSFRESVDWAHEKGIKTFVWFEPERVTHVDGLDKNFGYKPEWAVQGGGAAITNNIGDKECLDWTFGRIVNMMDENQVDLYREDNNSDPISCWAALDAKEGGNRAGISENKSVAGHYELWDRIIGFGARTGKDTFVDSCASGGGRNDLESMRRGVPFLRSDSDRTTTALRLSMQTGFNKWIPFCGCASTEQEGQLDPDGRRDPYIFRASYNPVFIIGAQWVQDPDTDFDMLRFGQAEWNSLKDYLLKEYYVLTKWNDANDRTNWTSYMYYDPEKDGGVLFAFRMEEAEAESCTVKLNMLEPDHDYTITNADTGETIRRGGRELAEGFAITQPQPRSAALFRIERA